jgi:DNA-binding LacI/PurR family transcriptional regulator
MATLKDIASRADVTVSTVSRALNGNPEIKKGTRDRIVEIAKELNYISNKNERYFFRSTLKTIGLICPEIRGNFYSSLANTMEIEIKEAGYTMILGLTNFKSEEELHYLDLFQKKNVDGIVFITTMDDSSKEKILDFKARCSIPMIQLASVFELEEYDCIKFDDKLGVTLAVEHLLELGHTDIAYIGENLTKDRQRHFIDVMKKHGIKIDNDFIKSGEERFEEAGYLRMKEILSAGEKRPTAIFASYDDVAIGAMRAIYENGLRIPEDISVIGIDNIYLTSYLYKSLSTISNPTNEMMNIAIKILLGKIEDRNNKVIQHVVVKPELIIRETTGRVPQKTISKK